LNEPSPAEKYRAAKKKSQLTELAKFTEELPFGLDKFQLDSCTALSEGKGVLVAAPTGAGKTVVGEFAIHLALAKNQKVFYTTPIKALSNQKYSELINRYGRERVGLLTGDNNQNSNAQIVVMTTEVLRNMIYAGSTALIDLGYVVMDEVHYLADRFRGAVWEEVILHLPKDVKVASLSATVSNAEEFGAWLAEVRGDTEIIVSEHRPVPLHQHVLFGDELIELFDAKSGQTKVNQNLLQRHQSKLRVPSHRARNGKQGRYIKRQNQIERLSKPEVVEVLENQQLLPAIFFIFSRIGCEKAVEACARSNLRLTSREEQEEIRRQVELRCASIADEDLDTLGYFEWLSALEKGYAAHHAGMLPAFKEVVEELFQQKLVRVVFATETLALGINMPARTVVLEKLDKYNGESRVGITPGEYTQLTGRAGRRGIDVEGHSVILWSSQLDPNSVAGLASKRTYPLNSSFRPTYNMGVNLISAFGMELASSILEKSFAQYQADKSVVGIASNIEQREKSLQGYEEAMSCHLGDFKEYSTIRRDISDLEKKLSFAKKRDMRESKGRHLDEKHLAELKRKLRAHPAHRCPERETHARWGERYQKLKREIEKDLAKIDSRTNRVSKTFERIVALLEQLGYLQKNKELEVTPKGERLAKIYGERDLLIAECVNQGAWKNLDPANLAALAVSLVYEGKREDNEYQPKIPKGQFEIALEKTERIQRELADLQNDYQLKTEPILELGLCYPMYRWAKGANLDTVLDITGMLPGDFIRWSKQLIDLLDQLSTSADAKVAETAYQATDMVKRGIVAYSYYV
jgi:ATP-dependent RNA helicase HelY